MTNHDENQEWIAESESIDHLDISIYFLLHEKFYFGDPNNWKKLKDKAYYLPLVLPDFPRIEPLRARCREIIGHEHKLIEYYRRIIEQAVRHDYDFKQISQYFWMRLELNHTQMNIYFPFPWYDTASEINRFLDWLIEMPQNNPFCDVDQGWQIDAQLVGDRVHLLQSIPDEEMDENEDEDEGSSNVAVAWQPLVKQAVEEKQRATKIIADLTAALGIDLWTSCGYQFNPRLDKANWRLK